MTEGRMFFCGEDDKLAYVLECEHRFEADLDRAIETMQARANSIITLSGPTCSGKTTMAKKIVSEFTALGKRVHIVSIDDFYYDREKLIEMSKRDNREPDFDSVSAIDLQLLRETIDEIFVSDTVVMPIFDFNVGARAGQREYKIDENDMFVFEGIQALYPEVTALFGERPYTSVYVCVGDSLQLGENVFSPEELRLMRRLVRDYNFRNASPMLTFHMWGGVRRNEDANIFPHAGNSDIEINSLMPYEVSMLKPYLVPILSSVSRKSEYYESALQIIKKTEKIEEISSKYMPINSVFHEFLG